MEKLPARTGWFWVREGFRLFRRQPAEVSTLFLAYALLMILLGVVPLLGQILPLLLVPVFAIAFMEAGRQLDQGQRVTPALLLTGFRSPMRRELLKLGVLYLVAALLAAGVAMLVDDGTYWKMLTQSDQVSAKEMQNSNVGITVMSAAAIYGLATLCLWFAAPLIAWQGMKVGKAVFYSFFAVRYNMGAFLAYGMAWAGLALLPSIASSVVAILFGQAFIARALAMSLLLVLVVVLHCSFYPSYAGVFGKREAGSADPPRLPG
ncbi:MAG TPA: BPSS1780 family membrane protein [Noviherbaspirillum sp.]